MLSSSRNGARCGGSAQPRDAFVVGKLLVRVRGAMIMMSEWTLSLATLAARKDVGADDLLAGEVPAALGENLVFVVEAGNISAYVLLDRYGYCIRV